MPVLLLVVFINFVGIGALIPVLPYTVIETLGLSATVMTLLLASFAFAMFLSNPLLGRLSDYIGRRPVLIVSLAVNVLAHIWFAFSSDIVQMFAARILAGLAAGNTGVIQAVIAARVAAKDRARYLGLADRFLLVRVPGARGHERPSSAASTRTRTTSWMRSSSWPASR